MRIVSIIIKYENKIKKKRNNYATNAFEHPTDHYDERLSSIDEKICSLLKERKELSNGNPGFPPDEAISNWAKQNGLYPDYLNSLFSSMMDEDEFKPRVEPTKFKNIYPF